MPELKGFDEAVKLWQKRGSSEDAAKLITAGQVDALTEIINDDNKWHKLLEVFRRGRLHDAWLAVEWPDGFDELILCAPLCKLVEWECAHCHIGKRQDNFSCANDDSLFGYIAVLMALENRELLIQHLKKIKLVLDNENIFWDISRHEVINRTPIDGE
jgi:hypothetical protein